MMELRHLKYFIAVADMAHFSRAAATLNVAQPALSMQIKDLEEEVGTLLFCRTTRRVELTDAGTLFYEEARKVLEQAERAVTMARRTGSGLKGSLRIGYAANALSCGVLPLLLRRYRQGHPEVDVLLREMSFAKRPNVILQDVVDLCLAPSHQEETPRGLSAKRLAEWPWIIGLSEEHPLAGNSFLTGDMLIGERFMVRSEGDCDDGHVSTISRLLKQNPRVAYRSEHAINLLTLTAAGYGIALLPGCYLSHPFPHLTYVPVRGFNERADITLYYHSDEERPAVRAFCELSTVKD